MRRIFCNLHRIEPGKNVNQRPFDEGLSREQARQLFDKRTPAFSPAANEILVNILKPRCEMKESLVTS